MIAFSGVRISWLIFAKTVAPDFRANRELLKSTQSEFVSVEKYRSEFNRTHGFSSFLVKCWPATYQRHLLPDFFSKFKFANY
jgi:hypothetical protein